MYVAITVDSLVFISPVGLFERCLIGLAVPVIFLERLMDEPKDWLRSIPLTGWVTIIGGGIAAVWKRRDNKRQAFLDREARFDAQMKEMAQAYILDRQVQSKEWNELLAYYKASNADCHAEREMLFNRVEELEKKVAEYKEHRS